MHYYIWLLGLAITYCAMAIVCSEMVKEEDVVNSKEAGGDNYSVRRGGSKDGGGICFILKGGCIVGEIYL